MRYLALATDYDGTIAHHGRVDEPTLDALRRLRDSGRRLLLVTGRELPELLDILPQINLFECVVAENGALLYDPRTREELLIAEPPPPAFVEALKARGVGPISVGRSIVATWEPHETAVLQTIHDLGLEMQVIFNKGAVMILPSGVNKATGLAAALSQRGLSPHNCVGVGDAENDHALLALCECSVAVANALPSLRARADLVTGGRHGAGVAELIDLMIADDLASLAPRLGRHTILLGRREDGREERLEPYGINVLVTGSSGSGKSTLTTGVLERLQAASYQYIIIDPEGDYSTLEGAVVLGDPHRAPLTHEVMDLLHKPGEDVVVNLLGVPLEHRPSFSDGLLPHLEGLRTRAGRPHWIVVDEAHHLLPSGWRSADRSMPRRPQGMLFITVHPESLSPAVLEAIDVLLVVGEAPEERLKAFCSATDRAAPPTKPIVLAPGEIVAWHPRSGDAPVRVKTEPPKTERRRHSRKYAEGNLGPGRSFYFRGPGEKLNLKAHNLVLFLQLAEGIDDETWTYHLKRGDYSGWFRDGIKDERLAAEAAAIEADPATPKESRAAIRAAVERYYTLPADAPSGKVDPKEVG